MVEILWRSMPHGFRIQQVFACVFSFLFSWPLERYDVTSMHNAHNYTHLLMNKVTHSFFCKVTHS
jgi:hypothetical protein